MTAFRRAKSDVTDEQKPTMQAPAGNRSTSHDGGRNETIPEETVISSGIVAIVNSGPVGATRFERPTSTPKNTTISDSGGAKSGALPADLARLIEAWGGLAEDDRRRIRAIVDGRLA
jgi:hypothetical protein